MQRTSRVWKRMAVVAFLVLGSGIVNAQSPSDAQMTEERSWQLQSVLQSIDADRETWVNLLVSRWSAVLNPAVYDVASELGSVARVAPAWQLYGAYLASDFMTASDILHGRRNAGPYIAGLSASGANQAQSVAVPQVLGDFVTEQVYNVVSPPCRVVDTRLPGARTGIVVPNTLRTFDLTTEAETEGQGGGPFPCAGLPSDPSHCLGGQHRGRRHECVYQPRRLEGVAVYRSRTDRERHQLDARSEWRHSKRPHAHRLPGVCR